jgi:hypothetical protein
MLSAYSFFRGNYMTVDRAQALLCNLCGTSELVPDFWNIAEPIDKPFDPSDISPVICGSMVPAENARMHHKRTLALFARVNEPRYHLLIDLRLAPIQWTSAHNCISIHFEEAWPNGESKLAQYLSSSVLPDFPDYAKIIESSQDPERLKEFRGSLSAIKLRESIAKRVVTLPFGPYGCIEDIYWFNYFGRVLVDFIGRERLFSAGWARIEETGGGLACYASPNIDDVSLQKQRSRIASQLEEFLWTPGCRPENKRIPVFEFSAQTEAFRAVGAEPHTPTIAPEVNGNQ